MKQKEWLQNPHFCTVCSHVGREFSKDLSKFKDKSLFFDILASLCIRRPVKTSPKIATISQLKTKAKYLHDRNHHIFSSLFPHISNVTEMYKTAKCFLEEMKSEDPTYKLPCSMENFVCDPCFFGHQYLLHEKQNYSNEEIPLISITGFTDQFEFEYKNKIAPDHPTAFTGKIDGPFDPSDLNHDQSAGRHFTSMTNCMSSFVNFLKSRFEYHPIKVSLESLILSKEEVFGDNEMKDEEESEKKMNSSIQLKRLLTDALYVTVRKILKDANFDIFGKTKVGELMRKKDSSFVSNNIRYNYNKKQYMLSVDQLNTQKTFANSPLYFSCLKTVFNNLGESANRRKLAYLSLKKSNNFDEPDLTVYFNFKKTEKPFVFMGENFDSLFFLSLEWSKCLDETTTVSDLSRVKFCSMIGRDSVPQHPAPHEFGSTFLSSMCTYSISKSKKLTPPDFRMLLGNDLWGKSLKELENTLHFRDLDPKVLLDLFKGSLWHSFAEEDPSQILGITQFVNVFKSDELGFKELQNNCMSANQMIPIKTCVVIDPNDSEHLNLFTSDKTVPFEHKFDDGDLERILFPIRFRNFLFAGGDEPEELFKRSKNHLEDTMFHGFGPDRLRYDPRVHMPKGIGRIRVIEILRWEKDLRKCIGEGQSASERKLRNDFSAEFMKVLYRWSIFNRNLVLEQKIVDGNIKKVYSRKLFQRNKERIIKVDGDQALRVLGVHAKMPQIRNFESMYEELAACVLKFWEDNRDSHVKVNEKGFKFFYRFIRSDSKSFVENEVIIHRIFRKSDVSTDGQVILVLPRCLSKSIARQKIWSGKIRKSSRYFVYRDYSGCMYVKVIFEPTGPDGMDEEERMNSGKGGHKAHWVQTTKFLAHGNYKKISFKHLYKRTRLCNKHGGPATDTILQMMLQEVNGNPLLQKMYFDKSLYSDQVSFHVEEILDETNPQFPDQIRSFVKECLRKERFVDDPTEQFDIYKDRIEEDIKKVEFEEKEEVLKFVKRSEEWRKEYDEVMTEVDRRHNERVLSFSASIPTELTSPDANGKRVVNKNQEDYFQSVKNRVLSNDYSNTAVFCETSVGKTRMGVMTGNAHIYCDRAPVVLVAPSITLSGWKEEIAFWTEDLIYREVKIFDCYNQSLNSKKSFRKLKGIGRAGGWILMHQELVTTLEKRFEERKMLENSKEDCYALLYFYLMENERTVLLLDEITKVIDGKRYKILKKSKAKTSYGYTATPSSDMGESTADVFEVLFRRLNDKTIDSNLDVFRSTMIEVSSCGENEVLFIEKSKVAKKILGRFDRYIFSRLEPLKIYHERTLLKMNEFIVFCDLSKDQKEMVENIESQRVSRMIMAKHLEPVLTSPMDDYQLRTTPDLWDLVDVDSPRVTIIINLCKVIKKQEKKAVIFFKNVTTIKIVESLLTRFVVREQKKDLEEEIEGEEESDEELMVDEKEIPEEEEEEKEKRVFVIRGSDPKDPKDRSSVLKEIRELEGYGFLLVSSEIGQYGGNFQFCKYNIGFNVYWRHDRDHQEKQRVHRYGISENTARIQFVSCDTELEMLRRSIQKHAVLLSIFLGRKEFPNVVGGNSAIRNYMENNDECLNYNVRSNDSGTLFGQLLSELSQMNDVLLCVDRKKMESYLSSPKREIAERHEREESDRKRRKLNE